MKLLGLIPEPPLDPLSWSGSSAHLFSALSKRGELASAREVRLPVAQEACYKLLTVRFPLKRWRTAYHGSVARFSALSRVAEREVRNALDITAVLQVGAWFSIGARVRQPCFSYHDGNAALWYQMYGRGLSSSSEVRRHLAWEQKTYSEMRAIFVMSAWLASSFKNDFSVPSSKIHVVGAGINFTHLPALSPLVAKEPKFLFVGRDFERKGGLDLLAAFREVRREIPEATLTIVGPESGPLEAGVIFAGYLNKSLPADMARLQKLFQSALGFVLPSIYEPFGISLLEAMSYGVPCIAVDRCAMPEIVLNEQTGLIVPSGDVKKLATAMIALAKSPDTAAIFGREGRKRVEEHFTWSAVTKKISDVINSEIGKK